MRPWRSVPSAAIPRPYPTWSGATARRCTGSYSGPGLISTIATTCCRNVSCDAGAAIAVAGSEMTCVSVSSIYRDPPSSVQSFPDGPGKEENKRTCAAEQPEQCQATRCGGGQLGG